MSIVAEAGFGPVAQRLEQWTHNPLVQGSNPCGPTTTPFLFQRLGAHSASWEWLPNFQCAQNCAHPGEPSH